MNKKRAVVSILVVALLIMAGSAYSAFSSPSAPGTIGTGTHVPKTMLFFDMVPVQGPVVPLRWLHVEPEKGDAIVRISALGNGTILVLVEHLKGDSHYGVYLALREDNDPDFAETSPSTHLVLVGTLTTDKNGNGHFMGSFSVNLTIHTHLGVRLHIGPFRVLKSDPHFLPVVFNQ